MSKSVDEINDMLCNGPEEMGMLGVSVRKMTALSVKMVTVTPIGKDRIWHSLCIKCMKLLVKYEAESKSKGKIHLTALIEVTVGNFIYHFST